MLGNSNVGMSRNGGYVHFIYIYTFWWDMISCVLCIFSCLQTWTALQWKVLVSWLPKRCQWHVIILVWLKMGASPSNDSFSRTDDNYDKTLDFGVTQFQTTPHGWSSSHVIVYIRSVPLNIAESPNHSRANHQRHGGWKGLNSTIPVTKGLSYALLTDHSAGYGWK